MSKQNDTSPGLSRERALWQKGIQWVAGVDEVGRGCLSGPVVAAAVVIPANCDMLAGVRDSKKLSAAWREALCEAIRQQAVRCAVGAASVAEIERLNILYASYLAMQRAMERVMPYEHALIDGKDTDKVDLGEHTAVIGGDASSYAIACASIVAKVARDRLMARLARRFPGYAWEKNAGYGTPAHLQGLRDHGITPLHRKAYAPVKKILAEQNK